MHESLACSSARVTLIAPEKNSTCSFGRLQSKPGRSKTILASKLQTCIGSGTQTFSCATTYTYSFKLSCQSDDRSPQGFKPGYDPPSLAFPCNWFPIEASRRSCRTLSSPSLDAHGAGDRDARVLLLISCPSETPRLPMLLYKRQLARHGLLGSRTHIHGGCATTAKAAREV